MEFEVSRATMDDLDMLVAHRLAMWREVHPGIDADVDESTNRTREWISRKLTEGKLIGFVCREKNGKVAGSGCIWLREDVPRPINRRGENPYLMSMFTEKEYRRRGVANLIVQNAIDWCREQKFERIVLHASDDGKKLYETLGFFVTDNEMRLQL